MPEPEWDEGFTIVEVIEMTGPVERVVYFIGTCAPAGSWTRIETYRDDTLVHQEDFGFAPTLPLAELIHDVEEGVRQDARAVGARFEIRKVPAPCGQEQFEQMIATLMAA